MKIDIRNIPEDGLKIETKEPVGIIDVKVEGAGFKEPIDIDILANKAGNTLLINGDVKTKVDLVCSRCSKNFRQLLEDNNFNITKDIKGQTEVDLTEDIREGILILLPVKPLCKKDCRGICPSCGQDLNEKKCLCTAKGDVRWDKLGRINL